ncbi:unnamed protein product [Angiostrongylus costaricensis]|uniref:Polyprotein protein n=1 Tax=Angiostrongylus costaricensis TaxID=334426 RepID=A0A158PL83_ANGCS|nr:unnamed protein product [Angiostrongylus costaricensis]
MVLRKFPPVPPTQKALPTLAIFPSDVNNSEDKFVRLIRGRDASWNGGRTPQRLIRLVPVRSNGARPHSIGDLIVQSKEEPLSRIAIVLEKVASASENYNASIDRIIDEKLTRRDECSREHHRSRVEETEKYLPRGGSKENIMGSRPSSIKLDTLITIANMAHVIFGLLLNGQQSIDLRLDGIQREQLENKQHMEIGLRNVVDELKAEMVDKALEHAVELERMKIKQEHLNDDFSLLNIRLGEMEHLVSKLMQESDEPAIQVVRVQSTNEPSKIEELPLSDDSVHSVLSVSSGSPTEGPADSETRKPSQAFILTQRPACETVKIIRGDKTDTTHL